MVITQTAENMAKLYAFRDGVDGHNSRRMHPVAIEEVIKTTRWPF